jgi:hypothetical protein
MVADHRGTKRYGSLGFCIIDLFGNANSKQEQRFELIKGSPRNIEVIEMQRKLGMKQTVDARNKMPSLTFQLTDFSEFEGIKALIP